MAIWIVGDIHGHSAMLETLWERLDFDETQDQLWLVGDLVNRGPRSLEVLRWVQSLGERIGDRLVVTLGNHDLHLLGLHDGVVPVRPKDSDLQPILDAPDRGPLLDWLRRQKVFHRQGSDALVHAGLRPEWTLDRAGELAQAIEDQLHDPRRAASLLARNAPKEPSQLELWEALSALTHLRMLHPDGTPCGHKGRPADAPAGCRPWFRMPNRQHGEARVFFGHWAALGLFQDKGIIGLDSGCAWGGPLTAYHLETGRLMQQQAHGGG